MDEREDDFFDFPYYEATYLDDDNTKHIVKIKTNTELNFYKERFDVIEYNVVNII